MPRGIPNAKRDDVAMRFTTFHIPPQMNQKQGGSHYLKSEEQTLWGRSKKLAKSLAVESTQPSDVRRGSNVIVIHPGTRFLRIGRASDVFPVAIPNVIARKSKVAVSPPVYFSSIARNGKEASERKASKDDENRMDTAESDADQSDPSPEQPSAETSPILVSLRERMNFYKLDIDTNAPQTCTRYNEKVEPEVILDHNDPYRVEWISRKSSEDVLVGDSALRVGDPHLMGYTIRWPFHGGHFNSLDYATLGPEALLDDIETIWRFALRSALKIEPSSYRDYSVILIVPDLVERPYLYGLTNILLVQMGFKQICVQQESLSATFGAGISNACVIDAGAAKTSIAIVDEGMVIPDTRICLSMGGDDITEFLLFLLKRVHFPYRDVDLARTYDWNLIEDLKARICTLAESDVALRLYDFVIRRPGQPTRKYALRTYNENILAPMCLFEPRVIEFERKAVYSRPLWSPEVGDEIVEQVGDQICCVWANLKTQAMIISTQHLLPASTSTPLPSQAAPPPPPPAEPVPLEMLDPLVDFSRGFGRPVFSVAPQEAAAAAVLEPPQVGTFAGHTQSRFISLDASSFEMTAAASSSSSAAPQGDVVRAEVTAPENSSEEKMEDPDSKGGAEQQDAPPPQQDADSQPASYPGGFGIDVAFEAGKLPLDVAIFNSARAAGGDEKIRKYLQAVLVVGGSARIPGMAHALESRLQAIASPLVANMEKVQIIPPPRDVDPRVLCWKGGAVLGKMEAVSDLWVRRTDWDILGMRALKERSFFL